MKAGVSTACLYPLEVEKVFRRLAERGVPLAEIFVNTDCELESPYLDEMLAVQREYGIEVCSVHPFICEIEPNMMFTAYERRLSDLLKYMRKFFLFMNKLGAKYYVLHGNKPQNPCEDERYFERYLAVQKAASEYGIVIAQENVARCVSSSADFLKRMSAALGDEVKFVLDTKQARRSGVDPIELADALGGKIVHVHYSDCGEKGDCLKFGEGSFDNVRFFNTLKKHGCKGDAVIELYRGNHCGADDLAENCMELNRFLAEVIG